MWTYCSWFLEVWLVPFNKISGLHPFIWYGTLTGDWLTAHRLEEKRKSGIRSFWGRGGCATPTSLSLHLVNMEVAITKPRTLWDATLTLAKLRWGPLRADFALYLPASPGLRLHFAYARWVYTVSACLSACFPTFFCLFSPFSCNWMCISVSLSLSLLQSFLLSKHIPFSGSQLEKNYNY